MSDLEKLLEETTPGPWVTGGLGTVWTQVGIEEIADTWGVKMDANARLIAMAPDLARKVIAAEKLVEALARAEKFIASEYGSAEAQAMQGEFLSAVARPVHLTICEALATWEDAQ